MMMMSAFHQTNRLSRIFNVSWLKEQAICSHVAPLGHNQTLLLLFMVRAERSSNKNEFHNFGLTWLGFELTIYLTQGQHTNHSNTGLVLIWNMGFDDICWQIKCYYTNVRGNQTGNHEWTIQRHKTQDESEQNNENITQHRNLTS